MKRLVIALLFLLLVIVGCSSESDNDSLTGGATVDIPDEVLEDVNETEVEEPVVEEVVEELEIIQPEEPAEELDPSSSITVNLIEEGFEEFEIHIKAGDTVVWQNVRETGVTKAMIIGTQRCNKVKSGMFEAGESFSWKFEDPVKCTIVDGIFTTQLMKVIVE
jgi:plastocyanin